MLIWPLIRGESAVGRIECRMREGYVGIVATGNMTRCAAVTLAIRSTALSPHETSTVLKGKWSAAIFSGKMNARRLGTLIGSKA